MSMRRFIETEQKKKEKKKRKLVGRLLSHSGGKKEGGEPYLFPDKKERRKGEGEKFPTRLEFSVKKGKGTSSAQGRKGKKKKRKKGKKGY